MHSLWQDYTPSPDYGQLLKALILLGLKVLAEGQRPSEREQLHLPDGSHHQVLRRAVIKGFAGDKAVSFVSSGNKMFNYACGLRIAPCGV